MKRTLTLDQEKGFSGEGLEWLVGNEGRKEKGHYYVM